MPKFDNYVAPKRGRLPRIYERIDQPPFTTKQQLRWISILLAMLAGICYALWRVLK